MSAPLGIACLGAARIAPAAIIFPAKVRGDTALVAIAARDAARAEDFAKAHGFRRAYGDYQAAIEDAEVGLVYNALPINLHCAWSIRALEAGKHVLCEKPFAMNAGEAQRMADAAAASGARLIEAFHYRYHPLYASYRGLLAQGAIGKIRSFEATFDAAIADKGGAEIRHLPETGGGAFMDLGCYPLSWMLTTFDDDPASVSAHARLTARGVDEAMGAEFCFADGATARLSTSMATDRPFAAMLRVVGEAGEIVFDNPLAPHRGARIRLTREGRQTVLAADRLTTYFHQLEAIIRALTTGEALPTEGAAILRQQRWLDAVYDAAGLAGLRWRETTNAP